MTAFAGAALAWISVSALYLGAIYLACWSYTGHWPVHAAWLVVVSLFSGLSTGAKALEALVE